MCLLVSCQHDLWKNMGDIDACTDFEMLIVKVPIIFPAQWVFLYVGRDVGDLSKESYVIVIYPKFVVGATASDYMNGAWLLPSS